MPQNHNSSHPNPTSSLPSTPLSHHQQSSHVEDQPHEHKTQTTYHPSQIPSRTRSTWVYNVNGVSCHITKRLKWAHRRKVSSSHFSYISHSKTALGNFWSGCFFFHHKLSHSSAEELLSSEVGLGLEKFKSPVIGWTLCASDIYSNPRLLERTADDVGAMSCALRYAL